MDIFISYASEDRSQAAELARFLEESGYSVWWDRELIGGDRFDASIRDALGACRAAVVIWTPASVKSRWVLGEAETAAADSKLIPVRADSLKPEQLPIGFRALHTVLLNDRADILKSIEYHFATPPKAIGLGQKVKNRLAEWLNRIRRRLTVGNAAIAVLVALIVGYIGIDALDWNRISNSVERIDFEHHLQRFPVSFFTAAARAKLEGADEWTDVKASTDIAKLDSYIEKYPKSLYTPFTSLRLGRLRTVDGGNYTPLFHKSFGNQDGGTLSAADLGSITDCDELYRARNEIFYYLGYCFLSERGRDTFKTAKDCPYADCNMVLRFNDFVDDIMPSGARDNIDTINKREKAIKCPLPPVSPICRR